MKKYGYAVIGAGYGDEGKGLLTDFLVRKFGATGKPIVNVRFNGGAQAGHTVVTEKERHVFGHFGAGTFAGASTFLSSKFIFNPYAFRREYDVLRTANHRIVVDVHPDCMVTTTYDMVLNGLRELARGDGKHGSCGLGINETVTRHLAGQTLTVSDLFKPNLDEIIYNMWYNWWYPRFKEIDLSNADQVKVHALLDAFYSVDADNLYGYRLPINVTTLPDTNAEWYIFEGAQGLQLDEYLGEFPHVTRSVTGLPSAILAAHEAGVSSITPMYVTRCYKTRHGAGPLSHEGEKFSESEIVDQTNVTGQWQGNFRYAPLDLAELERFIKRDLDRCTDMARVLQVEIQSPRLNVTCTDQVGKEISWYDVNGKLTTGSIYHLYAQLDQIALIKYVSHGPTAADVKVLD